MSSENTLSAAERLNHLEGHYAHRVRAFRQQLAQLGPDRVLIILLDIGKNAHWASASTAADQELVAPHRLPTTRSGLSQFIHMVDSLVAAHHPKLVILGHEPTSVYHEPWARALLDYYDSHLNGQAQPPFDYRFFNTFQVKLARQQTHLRHRKSDPKDLAAMFDLSLRGLGQPAFLPSGNELLIRQEVGFIQAHSKLLAYLERQLRLQLDRLWPGAIVNLQQFRQAHPTLPRPAPVIQTKPFQRQRLRLLLAHCPNPHTLAAMSDHQILALYRDNGGRAGPALLRDLRNWLASAVLLSPAIAAPLADQLQSTFLHYLASETLIEEGRSRLLPLIPHTPARHLSAIPGLSDYDGACYLAGIGAVPRFHRDAEVWAFAGFDPIQDGSGDRPERIGHLSKRGDPAFRDALYQMGYRTALHYAPLSLTFLDAFDRGLCEVEATIHTAHRLNRICFHLLQHDEPFDNRSTPQLEAEKERRWSLFRAEKKRRGSRRKRGKRARRR